MTWIANNWQEIVAIVGGAFVTGGAALKWLIGTFEERTRKFEEKLQIQEAKQDRKRTEFETTLRMQIDRLQRENSDLRQEIIQLREQLGILKGVLKAHGVEDMI